MSLLPPGALVIARQDLLDATRSRRLLVIRALTPVLLVASLIAIVALTNTDDALADDSYEVVIEDPGGNDDLVAALAARISLDITVVDDVIAERAGSDVAVVLPAGGDVRLAAGEPIAVRIYETSTNKQSRAAGAEFQTAMGQHAVSARESGTSPSVELTFIDVEFEEAGARSAVGGLVTALVVLQAAVLVGGASARFASRRNAGLLTAQLLHPLDRPALVLGKGLAELTVGLLAAVPILALAALLMATTMLATGQSALAAGAAVVAIAATAAAIGFPVTSVGLFIGITSRSAEQAGLATTGVIVALAATANLTALADTDPPAWVAAIPIVGATSVLRSILGDGAGPIEILVATASTLLFGLAVTRFAASRFDSERLTLRAE